MITCGYKGALLADYFAVDADSVVEAKFILQIAINDMRDRYDDQKRDKFEWYEMYINDRNVMTLLVGTIPNVDDFNFFSIEEYWGSKYKVIKQKQGSQQ